MLLYYFYYLWGWSQTKSTITAVINWPLYQPYMIDSDYYDSIRGMNEWQENRSTWRKPAQVLLCPKQILYDLTRAAAMGSRRRMPY